METEIWKPVIGFDGLYEVSNKARVRTRRGLIMKQIINTSGYYHLKLMKHGKYYHKLVHVMVAEIFVQKPLVPTEIKLEVNHIDRNRLNALPENLEWITHKENIAKSLIGEMGYMYGRGNSEVNNDFILAVKRMREQMLLVREIAAIMNVKLCVIKDLLGGRRHTTLLKQMGLKIEGKRENSKIVNIDGG